MQEIFSLAADVLRKGGTLLYPTDTIWGLGCDATNAKAIDHLFAIKERPANKSLIWLVRSEWVTTDLPNAYELLTQSDRPTTLILPANHLTIHADGCGHLPPTMPTIAIRSPRHHFCQQLLQLFGRPITSTSANISGEPSPQGYDDISPLIRERADYRVPALQEFVSGRTASSRIIAIATDGAQTTIRE